ncbi:MAG: hypothetical protein LBD27_06730, partial [Tannerella sp.]|nr:hypothetical protein [Tannerella sp.]
MPLSAQTPGNVTNAAYTWAAWLTPNNYSSGTWRNLITTPGSVGNFSIGSGGTPPLMITTGGFNFHPAVKFDKSSDSYGVAAPNQLYSSASFGLTGSHNVTMFFVLQRATTDNYDVLMGFSNADGYASVSWRTNGNDDIFCNWPNAAGSGTVNHNLGAMRNGIFAIDNANVDTNPGGINVYKNGISSANTTRLYPWNGTTNAGNGSVALGGGRNNQAWYGYQGTIQEVILLKKSGNGHLDPLDVQKIHSYLAVKYGITLPSTTNYLASNGTTPVWNMTTNSGYNNHIFGIARDDAYRLYQKQSQSVTFPFFTAFVGSEVTNLNSNNSGQLDNGVYAMFGSNGGSLGQIINIPEIAVPGTSIKANYRRGLIYRAQLTNAATLRVKLRISEKIPLPEYVLISTTPGFLPGTTQVLRVSGNVVEGDLTDGCYITFGGYLPQNGRGPGGVTNNLKLWLRADDPASLVTEMLTTSTLNSSNRVRGYPDAPAGTLVAGVSEWKDMERGHTYTYAAGGIVDRHAEPVYQQSNYMTNYHPALRFWGSGTTYSTYLTNPTGIWISSMPTAGKHSAFFLVNNDFSSNDWFYTMMFGSGQPNVSAAAYNGPGYGVYRQTETSPCVGRLRTRGGGNSDTNVNGTKNLFSPNNTLILGYHPVISGSNITAKWRFNG